MNAIGYFNQAQSLKGEEAQKIKKKLYRGKNQQSYPRPERVSK